MKKIDPWKFIEGKWEVHKPSPEAEKEMCVAKNRLKMLTHNIMFDVVPRREEIVQSRKRYEYILKSLEREDFDILTLNEVTSTFLDILKSSVFVQSKYYLSTTSYPENKFGQVILSKFPFRFLYEYTYECLQPLTTCVIAGFGNHLAICSVHFLSLEENFGIREKQLNELYRILDTKEFEEFGQKIICGDFNFHEEEESKYIRNGYVDTWTKNFDLEKRPGFTFDAEKNKMITRIWEDEDRQMRLDRIIMWTKDGMEKRYECGNMALFLTEEIEKGVFASDHYGISYELTLHEN